MAKQIITLYHAGQKLITKDQQALGLGPVGGAFYLWDIGLKFGNRQLLASLSFATPVISSIALFLFGISTLSTAISIAIVLIMVGALISNAVPALIMKRRLRQAANA